MINVIGAAGALSLGGDAWKQTIGLIRSSRCARPGFGGQIIQLIADSDR
jgi:hypothetical protein